MTGTLVGTSASSSRKTASASRVAAKMAAPLLCSAARSGVDSHSEDQKERMTVRQASVLVAETLKSASK